MRFVAAVLLVAVLSCGEKEPGTVLARGLGRGLLVAPGGGAVAFLLDARHPDDRTVPDDLLLGDLYAAGTAGGPAKKIGSGVSSAAGSYRFSPGGSALAFVGAWRFRAGAGELQVAPGAGGAVRKLADETSSFGWAAKGEKLAWVAAGKLFALDGIGGAPRALGDGVQTFIWSPDATRIAARGPALGGGELWLVDVGSGERRSLGKSVTDYGFASDGALAFLGKPGQKGGDRPLYLVELGGTEPREVGRATAFLFSPNGRELLALSTDKQPGEATGELLRIGRGSQAPQPLAARGADFRFAPSGEAVFLARYDIRARAGTLSVAQAGGGAVREIAAKVQAFTITPDGKRVLYLAHKLSKGDFKIELWTAELNGGGEPRRVDEGVYGYEPAPDGRRLFWKSRCGYGPRSCSLFRGALDGSAPPVEVAKNVAGFELSGDGSRLLVSNPHRGSARAVDLSWLPSDAKAEEKARPVALDVDPSARFVDAGGKRAVLAVLQPGKQAVFLAELR